MTSKRKRSSEANIWPFEKVMRNHTRTLLPTLKPKVLHALLIDALDALDVVEELFAGALKEEAERKEKLEAEKEAGPS